MEDCFSHLMLVGWLTPTNIILEAAGANVSQKATKSLFN